MSRPPERAVPSLHKPTPQRERANPDDCNSTDRPAINPAGRPCTDGEGDAVHGGEEGDGRHSGGTDLDDDARKIRQYRMRDVAKEADGGHADQKAPEEPDGTTVVPLGVSVWVVIVPPSPL
jgi:hypothetical protein